MLLEEEKLEKIRETSNAKGRGQCTVPNKTVSVLLEEEKFEKRLEGGERLSQVTFLGKNIPEEGIEGGERALRHQGKTHSVP